VITLADLRSGVPVRVTLVKSRRKEFSWFTVVDSDVVDKPVSGLGAFVMPDDVSVDHGEGVLARELDRRVGRGELKSWGRLDL
jgi:hypothetical protein